MVGSPKRLADLAKIEANLAVRCRACDRRRVFDVALLGRRLVLECKNSSWSELPRAIPCACGSIDLSLKPMPFAAGALDPQMSRYERKMASVAIQVLGEVGQRSFSLSDIVQSVRLALRVLQPWASKSLLVNYWERFEAAGPAYDCPTLVRSRVAIEDELRMLGRLDAKPPSDPPSPAA